MNTEQIPHSQMQIAKPDVPPRDQVFHIQLQRIKLAPPGMKPALQTYYRITQTAQLLEQMDTSSI